jgi:hypothetical protein
MVYLSSSTQAHRRWVVRQPFLYRELYSDHPLISSTLLSPPPSHLFHPLTSFTLSSPSPSHLLGDTAAHLIHLISLSPIFHRPPSHLLGATAALGDTRCRAPVCPSRPPLRMGRFYPVCSLQQRRVTSCTVQCVSTAALINRPRVKGLPAALGRRMSSCSPAWAVAACNSELLKESKCAACTDLTRKPATPPRDVIAGSGIS